MDDIYKAAVRDWAGQGWGGWAHWGLTQLTLGGEVTPQRWWVARRGPRQLSAQAFKGMVEMAFQFQGVEGVKGSGS